MKKDQFCSYCGKEYPNPKQYPRTCLSCGQVVYANPIPVSVILVPVKGGLLGVRRGIHPGKGLPALPGGFIDLGETWQEAGARELLEEIQINVNVATIQLFRTISSEDGRLVLIFGISEPVNLTEQPPFTPSEEAMERQILRGTETLAFPIHESVMKEYFLNIESSNTVDTHN